MAYKFIDSHCHVHFQSYKEDMDEVVQRSLDEGIGMITIGTQSTTSKTGIDLAERYEGVWATIGLHPNHLHKQEFFDEAELPPSYGGTEGGQSATGKIKTRAEAFDPEYYRTLVSHPKVVGIGEFGLDYYRIPPDTDEEQMIKDQKDACRAQLKFATEVKKPIVIHCRDAHEDQAALLREEIEAGGLSKRGVIHSFTGTAEEAAIYHELGFYVAFNGILTFSKDLQKELAKIPLGQILVETDSPYLTPPPYRGKRNEPSYVQYVAQKVAEIKGISIDEVAERTVSNTVKLFGLIV
jgi:TatD DNase family protein